ncbi:U3 small nucleolar RNA-associated protein 18 homolog isoform X2 [Hetaerina americana]|uniref:U3 small nucleolar RNA-associated protein 18 homolog isoform X2 n=1 Tax=Hetaerina americana TaxID=62018 RepID=UPI003A7F17C0
MEDVLDSGRKRKNSDESDQNVFPSKSKARSSHSSKRLKTMSEEEVRLEKLVFGESSLFSRRNDFNRQFDPKDVEDLDSGLDEGYELGIGEFEGAMDVMTTSEDKTCRSVSDRKALQPAWHDDDDIPNRGSVGVSGNSLLWARLNQSSRDQPSRCVATSDSEDSDDEQSANSDDDGDLLRHCGDLLTGKRATVHYGSRGGSIPSGVLRFRKVNALNRATHFEGPLITNVQFHPTSSVAAVAGVAGVASILEVDGRNNAKLSSIQFERFPVHCARFSTDGMELLVGSKSHSHLYSYDLVGGRTTKIHINRALGTTNAKNFEISPDGDHIALAGRWGAVHIFSARTKEWITTLQMTGDVNCMSFSSDGLHLYTYGAAGEVWVWSMASHSCVHRFVDEGSFGGSALAVAPSGRFIACGCPSGNVNLYDRDEAFKPAINGPSRPTPICTISNLVTPITSLKFDPSSELLFLSSSEKAHAARLFHMPSRTVFINFPGRTPRMSNPLCVDFSPHGGYLTIGSSKGTALLYRLSHFGSY